MHRLFVAIVPPAPIRLLLARHMGGIVGARWQDDSQLHITLRFIGEVDRHRARDAAAALGAIHHPPFRVALSGLGQFDRKGHIDTLWVGLAPHDELARLHNKVDQALVRIGLDPETRAYLPHITIARFGRGVGSLAGFMDHIGPVESPAFDVSHFCLFESHLGRDGPVYEVIDRYPLA